MAFYSANNALGGSPQNLSSGYKSIVILTAVTSPAKRIRVYDMMVGVNGTPADNELEWDISRQTAAGTATAVTPTQMDPADGAAVTVASVNATAEGTVTANSSVWYVAMNQRASYRWTAVPGTELVGPATNLAGFTLRAKSAGYTGTVTGHLWFSE